MQIRESYKMILILRSFVGWAPGQVISLTNHFFGSEMTVNTKICKCSVLNLRNMSNFHPLEVVGRGSETQLQVGEN